MIHEIKQAKNASGLFAGWQETMVWSCLQGVMGKIYGDCAEKPESAMALLGDFAFFAGKPHRELVLEGPGKSGQSFLILTPQDEQWGELIADCLGQSVRKTVRYAIKKEPDVFCRPKLQAAVDNLPKGYELAGIDEAMFFAVGKFHGAGIGCPCTGIISIIRNMAWAWSYSEMESRSPEHPLTPAIRAA